LGHEDIKQKVEEAIVKITAEVGNIKNDAENSIPKVEEMGGTAEELGKRVEPVQREAGNVVKETQKEMEDITAEQKVEDSGQTQEIEKSTEVIEFEKFDDFKKSLSPELFPKIRDQIMEYIKQKYPELQSGTDEYKNKCIEIATGFEYKHNREHPYIKKYRPDINIEEYKQEKEELLKKMKAFDIIEEVKNKIAEQEQWDKQTLQEMKNEEFRKKAIEEFKKEGIRSREIKSIHNLNLLFENNLILADEIAQGIGNNWNDFKYILNKLSPEVLEKLKDAKYLTQDGRKIDFSLFFNDAYKERRQKFDNIREKSEGDLEGNAFDFAHASELVFLFKAINKPFDDEFKRAWNKKLSIVSKGVVEKDYVAHSFYKNADLKMAIMIDKRVLNEIILPGLKKDLKQNNYLATAVKTLEEMVKNNFITTEQAEEMYQEALR